MLRSASLDRLVEAAILWRAGAAPRIILTGGIGDPLGGTPSEATTMADLARSLGLPADALETETASRTTAESARNVRALHPDLRAIYLVSSAIHLPRGVALFRKQGFDVAPVPAGYLENEDGWTPQALLPGYEGLEDSTAAIHELAGLLAGR